jgi:hypothetical protein
LQELGVNGSVGTFCTWVLDPGKFSNSEQIGGEAAAAGQNRSVAMTDYDATGSDA